MPNEEINNSGEKPLNIDQELEKNILIRVMPRKIKGNLVKNGGEQHKVIGLVIISVGILVVGAIIYLGYVFLINPQNKNKVAQNNTPNVEQSTENNTPITEVASVTTETVTPAITPVASTTPVVVATSSPEVVAPTSTVNVVDTDKDGLSDSEESLLGTDPTKTDSDGDGYLDKAELDGLYNPAGSGKLADNTNIAQYKNSNPAYSVLYPKLWRIQKLTGSNSVIFSSADDYIIEIIAETGTDKNGIVDWYNNQFPDTTISSAEVITSASGEGVFNADASVFYLFDQAGKNIFTISYVPPSTGDLKYYNIFKMMINSFSAK